MTTDLTIFVRTELRNIVRANSLRTPVVVRIMNDWGILYCTSVSKKSCKKFDINLNFCLNTLNEECSKRDNDVWVIVKHD